MVSKILCSWDPCTIILFNVPSTAHYPDHAMFLNAKQSLFWEIVRVETDKKREIVELFMAS